MTGMAPFAIPGMACGFHLADVLDYSGNGRSLTANGAVYWLLGKHGNCVDLQGNSYLYRSDNGGINLANDYTMTLWIKVLTPPSSGVVASFFVQNRINGGRYHQFSYMNISGTLQVRLYNTGTDQRWITTLPLDKWYFCVVRNQSDVLELWMNGNHVMTASTGSTNSTATEFTIGGSNYNYNLTGRIDEFTLIPTALTNQQIRRLNAFQLGRFD